MNDAVAVLAGARELVSKGWVQKMGRSGDRRCAAQALQDAWIVHEHLAPPGACTCGSCFNTPTEEQRQHYSVAFTAFTQVIGSPGGSIPFWNDAPGRTKAQVLAAFDKAIEAVKAETVREVPQPDWAVPTEATMQVWDVSVTVPAPQPIKELVSVQ